MLYEAYTANALKTIAEITATLAGGSVEMPNYFDLWDNAFGEKKKENPQKTSEEIIGKVKHTLDVLSKL